MIILGMIVAFFIGYAMGNDEECPRIIVGWDCKGDRCDHSKEAIRQAKEIKKL